MLKLCLKQYIFTSYHFLAVIIIDLEVITISISISLPSFMSTRFTIQKIYSKIYSFSHANTHHEDITFEDDGIV